MEDLHACAHTRAHVHMHRMHIPNTARACTHTYLCLHMRTACSGHRQALGSVSCLSLHWLPSVSDLNLNLKDEQPTLPTCFSPECWSRSFPPGAPRRSDLLGVARAPDYLPGLARERVGPCAQGHPKVTGKQGGCLSHRTVGYLGLGSILPRPHQEPEISKK